MLFRNLQANTRTPGFVASCWEAAALTASQSHLAALIVWPFQSVLLPVVETTKCGFVSCLSVKTCRCHLLWNEIVCLSWATDRSLPPHTHPIKSFLCLSETSFIYLYMFVFFVGACRCCWMLLDHSDSFTSSLFEELHGKLSLSQFLTR